MLKSNGRKQQKLGEFSYLIIASAYEVLINTYGNSPIRQNIFQSWSYFTVYVYTDKYFLYYFWLSRMKPECTRISENVSAFYFSGTAFLERTEDAFFLCRSTAVWNSMFKLRFSLFFSFFESLKTVKRKKQLNVIKVDSVLTLEFIDCFLPCIWNTYRISVPVNHNVVKLSIC